MKKKIALVLCPFWNAEYLPLSIAIPCANLKSKGYRVAALDLNKEFQLKHRRTYESMAGESNPLQDDTLFVRRFALRNGGFISSAVDRILKSGAEIVVFIIYSTNKILSLEIANGVKEKDKARKIIFSGAGCEYDKISLGDTVDLVVSGGEAGEALTELIERMNSKGSVEKTRGEAPVQGLNSLPFPDFSGILDLYRVKEIKGDFVLPIKASRGCIERCAFCNEIVAQKKYLRMKAERIFAEIKNGHDEYGATRYAFLDNLINGDIKELERFCDLMIDYNAGLLIESIRTGHSNKNIRGIIWRGMAVVRREMTQEFLRKMKRAGCVILGYEIGSGSGRILNKMNKKFTAREAVRVLRATHEAGIECHMTLINGFPGETKEDFKRTLGFLDKVSPYISSVYFTRTFCTVNKGNYLYKHYKKYGITDRSHHLFWKSDKGKNNYEERFRRYEEFSRRAERSGIRVIPEKRQMDKVKDLLLNAYYQYEKESKIIREAGHERYDQRG